MANWLDRAKREIPQSAGRATANSAERIPTAVTAVPIPGKSEISRASIGSNGSAPPWGLQESEVLRETFEERAAIMEFDGGLTRAEAERLAFADLTMKGLNDGN